MASSKDKFLEYIQKRENDVYNVQFPNREFQEYLKIPDHGKLGDLVKLFEHLKEVVVATGFRWNIDIDEENLILKVTDII